MAFDYICAPPLNEAARRLNFFTKSFFDGRISAPERVEVRKNYGRVTWSGVATEVREFPGTFPVTIKNYFIMRITRFEDVYFLMQK